MSKARSTPDAVRHIPAQCGSPYVLERHGKTYHLTRDVTRRNGNRAHMRILLDRKDVIAVINGLIDLTERNVAT